MILSHFRPITVTVLFSIFCCSLFDNQMDPNETFGWYFHTSRLLWWRFLSWFFVCSIFDNRMETWTVDRSLCWFDHRDWAAYGVARPPGSKQENPAKSKTSTKFASSSSWFFDPPHLLFLFCFGQAMDVVETIQHQPNLLKLHLPLCWNSLYYAKIICTVLKLSVCDTLKYSVLC